MPGTFGYKRKRQGHGHGAGNHKHGGVNRCARYYYASFHALWRPERIEVKTSRSRKGFIIEKREKNKKNRRKQ
jgi:hypothetical protein